MSLQTITIEGIEFKCIKHHPDALRTWKASFEGAEIFLHYLSKKSNENIIHGHRWVITAYLEDVCLGEQQGKHLIDVF